MSPPRQNSTVGPASTVSSGSTTYQKLLHRLSIKADEAFMEFISTEDEATPPSPRPEETKQDTLDPLYGATTGLSLDELIEICAKVLTDVANLNDKIIYHGSAFQTRPGVIPFLEYLKRIKNYIFNYTIDLNNPDEAGEAEQILISTLILLDRHFTCYGPTSHQIPFSPLTMHKFFIVCLHINCKLIADKAFNNAYTAKVAGFPLDEFNQLEMRFLKNINFETFISQDDYKFYLEEIKAHHEKKKTAEAIKNQKPQGAIRPRSPCSK